MTAAVPVSRIAPQRSRAEALVADHLHAIDTPLASLRNASGQIARWGVTLAQRLSAGGRLLVAGNGGSAAEAQHLTAELVGRFDGNRPAYSAIALTSETSSLTAIGNDYGFEDVFARQVEAHGRRGDILLLLSTSGRSPNLLTAAHAARRSHLTSWAITGAAPNPLARAVDDALVLEGASPSIQEVELVAIHALCRAFDDAVGFGGGACES
ncbi:D-sedoheptulose-7-phosphate isomerase [Demequina sp. SO4-13]|uniref:D-sedoheptulose-7-phosphate isomerase n=1 Tax=Demequina sp. SO4-13 TaxID=3401027 RepID=UPI003AF89627